MIEASELLELAFGLIANDSVPAASANRLEQGQKWFAMYQEWKAQAKQPTNLEAATEAAAEEVIQKGFLQSGAVPLPETIRAILRSRLSAAASNLEAALRAKIAAIRQQGHFLLANELEQLLAAQPKPEAVASTKFDYVTRINHVAAEELGRIFGEKGKAQVQAIIDEAIDAGRRQTKPDVNKMELTPLEIEHARIHPTNTIDRSSPDYVDPITGMDNEGKYHGS